MKFETKCLHSGYKPENGGPGTIPIVQSTTYRFDSCDHVAALFDNPTEYMYSRFANPTCDAVEKKIADLEHGAAAMCTSSGQMASLMSILNLCNSGDSFVSASAIYGGTINLFAFTLKKLGIECIFVDVDASEEEIMDALKQVSSYKVRTWNNYRLDNFKNTICLAPSDINEIISFGEMAEKYASVLKIRFCIFFTININWVLI